MSASDRNAPPPKLAHVTEPVGSIQRNPDSNVTPDRRADSCVEGSMLRRAIVAALTCSLLTPALAWPTFQDKPANDPGYERIVQKVANMVDDERAYSMTSAFKLNLLNVMWEDTGRWEGSSVGPNISDVTI